MPRILQFSRRVAAGCTAGALAAATAALLAPQVMPRADAAMARTSSSAVPVPPPESVVMHLIWERTHCKGCETAVSGDPGMRRERAL